MNGLQSIKLLPIKGLKEYREKNPEDKWCLVNKETGVVYPRSANCIHFLDKQNKPREYTSSCAGMSHADLSDKYWVHFF